MSRAGQCNPLPIQVVVKKICSARGAPSAGGVLNGDSQTLDDKNFARTTITRNLLCYMTLTSHDLETTTKQLAGHVLVINDT